MTTNPDDVTGYRMIFQVVGAGDTILDEEEVRRADRIETRYRCGHGSTIDAEFFQERAEEQGRPDPRCGWCVSVGRNDATYRPVRVVRCDWCDDWFSVGEEAEEHVRYGCEG